MGLHAGAGDGQAQADAAIVRTVGGAKLYEGFEYFAKPFLRQALAVIENFQAQGAVVRMRLHAAREAIYGLLFAGLSGLLPVVIATLTVTVLTYILSRVWVFA